MANVPFRWTKSVVMAKFVGEFDLVAPSITVSLLILCVTHPSSSSAATIALLKPHANAISVHGYVPLLISYAQKLAPHRQQTTLSTLSTPSPKSLPLILLPRAHFPWTWTSLSMEPCVHSLTPRSVTTEKFVGKLSNDDDARMDRYLR